jgi:uncharacterized repeat protein (TIGR03803 family)
VIYSALETGFLPHVSLMRLSFKGGIQMQHRPNYAQPTRILALTTVLFIWSASALAAPKYQVLHDFGNGNDGAGLFGGVVRATDGKLYGTTSGGGLYQYGTVWQLTPHPNGKWSETVLENFKVNDSRGDEPTSTLTLDPSGNLYGSTTMGGGSHTAGTVFEMQPSSKGWILRVIHRFGKNDPAKGPVGGILIDPAGNLYGVGGWAFELSPGSDGWKETLIHEFNCQNGDGCVVLDRPIRDLAGNLYGTSQMGGTSKNCGGGCGTVYKLHPLSGGSWKETILHDFGAPMNGSYPAGELAIDAAGHLYGTTCCYGNLFELSPPLDGHWKETVLHRFRAQAGGGYPASVVKDAKGNLYGTTGFGGGPCDCGVLYKLSPQANGTWKYIVLYQFNGYDGTGSGLPMLFDEKGNLYGTGGGGAYGLGVVFEFTP